MPVRERLAKKWAGDGVAEHASVASFARFTLQLMSVGAPASLLFAAQRAAADEVRHARICFALAAAYAGKPVEPNTFPLVSPVHLETDLASVAASTTAEGCIEETLSCLTMAESCSRCEDPVVRACLTSIIRDEARHAALAWQTVAWTLQKDEEYKSPQDQNKLNSAERFGSVREAVCVELRKHVTETEATEQRKEYDENQIDLLDKSTACLLRGLAIKEVIRPLGQIVLSGKPITAEAVFEHIKQLNDYPAVVAALRAIVKAADKLTGSENN
jgi:hypothetical protein